MSACRSVGLSLLVVVSLLAISVPAATAADRPAVDRTDQQALQTPATTITGCTVIDESGHYQLGSDISADGTCIEITASDVVLDGQGHTVSDIDSNTAGNGIVVNSTSGRLSNVTIRDVTLTNWAWDDFGNNARSIYLQGVDDATITSVNITGGDYGIRWRNVTDSGIEDTRIAQTSDNAVYIDRNSENNTLAGNNITQAGDRGLLMQSSTNNTVHANQIAGSSNENVRLAGGANRNTFTDNVIHNSGFTDNCISAGTTASRLVIRNNTLTACGAHGIGLSQSGSNSVIEDNTVNGSSNHGIRLNRLDNATVRNNTASFNDGHGINVQRSSNVTVADNDARENERFGINLYDMTGTAVRNNTVASNENGGLRLVSGSSNNTLVDNTVLNFAREEVVSFPTGIRLRTADDNELRNNTVENAYIGIEVNESATGNTFVDNRVNNTATALWTFVTTNSDDTTVDSLAIGDSSAADTTLSFGAYNVSLTTNTSAPANPDATAIDRYATVESMGEGSFVNLSVHYTSDDVSAVNDSLLALWTHGDSGWTELEESAVNTRERTVSANVTNVSTVGVFATDDGDSHAIDLPPTPTPTDSDPATATPAADTTATGSAPSETQAGESEATTTGGSGPGFDAVAGVLALLACALLLRRES